MRQCGEVRNLWRHDEGELAVRRLCFWSGPPRLAMHVSRDRSRDGVVGTVIVETESGSPGFLLLGPQILPVK